MTTPENPRDQYQRYTTEYLLERIGKPELLTMEAEQQIILELNARGISNEQIKEQAPASGYQESVLSTFGTTPSATLPEKMKKESGRRYVVATLVCLTLFFAATFNAETFYAAIGIKGAVVTFIYWAMVFGGVVKLWKFISFEQQIEEYKQVGEGGLTELMFHAANGNLDVVRKRIRLGDSVDQANDNGVTALMLAIKNKHKDVAIELLRNGADPNMKAANGSTAYSIAKTVDWFLFPEIVREAAAKE